MLKRRVYGVLGWLVLGCFAATLAPGSERRARNVVLMIADGAGFNTWKATAMYEGSVGKDFHDGEGWVRLALSTHALRMYLQPSVSQEHALTQFPSLVYDPVKAWDTTSVEDGGGRYPYYFAGYRWLRETAPDSANTISALVTGAKTYRGSVNFDGAGRPVDETIAALAHRAGMRVGTVSSVLFAHATPAAGAGAHQAHRSSYCELAVEMLTGDYPEVIAGCGHPDFDNNGERLDEGQIKDYGQVGGKEIWDLLAGAGRLKAGQLVCVPETAGVEGGTALTAEQIATLERWSLVESRSKIEALGAGATPERLLIVPRVGSASFWGGFSLDPAKPNMIRLGGTLHQQRGSRADPEYTDPGYDPPLPEVPTLETLTRAALNGLDHGDGGFFLQVEGGAVDWAMHGNQLGRTVEEMIDFKRSIGAVIEWVERNGGWEQTLLVVTSDHDHMLWGPDADTVPFDPLRDNGPGRLPSYRWLSNGHSNALVPVFARGVGAEMLPEMARGNDPFYGPYADQTDVFRLMRSVLVPDSAP